MVAYRFCRPDDAGRIVDAIRACFDVHFQKEKMSLEQFQREVREIDLWPSNCMLATEGHEPIAVCTAAKRPREVFVQRIGVRPGCERRGHGSHLLTSLRKKLQVLGPSRLVTEIPAQRKDLVDFFRSLRWIIEGHYRDYSLLEPLEGLKRADAIIPVSVAELVEAGLLTDSSSLPWERQLGTLKARADKLEGWAIASLDRIEAGVLFRDEKDPPQRTIVQLVVQESATDPELLARVLLRIVGSAKKSLLFPRVAESEPVTNWLEQAGFQMGEQWVRMAICGPDFERE